MHASALKATEGRPAKVSALGWVAAILASACATTVDRQAGGSTDTAADSGSDPSDGGESTFADLEPLPPLDDVLLTDERTLRPQSEPNPEPYLDPRRPAELDRMLAEGLADEVQGPAEPVLDRTGDDEAPPGSGSNARVVARFVHLADAQLADDESPTRVANIDRPGILSGAFRPQEAYGCHLLNAAARTINAIDARVPLDLVVLGGDNIDSAQTNELKWFLGVMAGRVIHCDSGDDDDPIAGPSNDPKDAFASVGLAVPWLWVTGNHDVLVQGNFTVQSRAGFELDTTNVDGTRDWSQPGGPVVTGEVPADAERRLLSAEALLANVMNDGDGHGLAADLAVPDRAHYPLDVGDRVRLIVVDTAAHTGGAEGVVRGGDIDAAVRPFLEEAEVDGRWVVVVTHHASGSLGDGGSLGGMVQADAWTPEEWRALLGGFPNVLMHLCGHSHAHRVDWMEGVQWSYWEVITSALADFPHQMRLIEIRDEDNGFVSIGLVGIDSAVQGDPLATDGRARAIVDYTSGWQTSGSGELTDRNVRLWVEKP